MSTEVTVPAMGESINEAVILRWLKNDGEHVTLDEPICELETDKATFDLPAPATGTLKTRKGVGDTVQVGEGVAEIDESGKAAPPSQDSAPAKQTAPEPQPAKVEAARPAPAKPESRQPTTKPTPAPSAVRERAPVAQPAAKAHPERENGAPQRAVAERKPTVPKSDAEGSRRVPMTKIRRRIAERLVRAQHTAAMLTTFNEIDMTNVLDLRARHKEQFEQTNGVSLGLMSFFSHATVLALKQYPAVNAEIEGDDIIYHDHVHLGVAVSTERGLVVPVLRHAEEMSFAKVESEIKRVAIAARDGKLALNELSGGTFTITNGGVFGSLLSTPILNPPQSGILGMHTIQKRPMVMENDRIEARRMMYVALSYDHRLVDGREAVLFLVKLKHLLEDPLSMLLEE